MVDFELTDVEVRVLGCLMEKEMATPEYYPLSLNALVNACNQKSNRNPVVSYDEDTVLEALEELKASHLAWQSDAGRVSKYSHHIGKSFNLINREMAVLGILLLRGPQTLGELRSRSERMYGFSDIDEVSETINSLGEIGLVRQLERQPGQKESRYTHLLTGDTAELLTGCDQVSEDSPQAPPRNERIAILEEETKTLRSELDELKRAFQDFKQQFE